MEFHSHQREKKATFQVLGQLSQKEWCSLIPGLHVAKTLRNSVLCEQEREGGRENERVSWFQPQQDAVIHNAWPRIPSSNGRNCHKSLTVALRLYHSWAICISCNSSFQSVWREDAMKTLTPSVLGSLEICSDGSPSHQILPLFLTHFIPGILISTSLVI